MNRQECDVLKQLMLKPSITQRTIAQLSGHSLGVVNRSIKELIRTDYLNSELKPTQKAHVEVMENSPKNAIILAAGFGMRMVPINTECPKGLLEINGETLIERLIKQLHEVNIKEIYVVVGFMKEKYEYLIDEYGVDMVVNPEYSIKNNLHSIKLVINKISNSYIIPCDIWCNRNPFYSRELYSWYMVSDSIVQDSTVRINRKMELVRVSSASSGNAMIGISYLIEKQSSLIRSKIEKLSEDSRFDNSFWEESLYHQGKMLLEPNMVQSSDVLEINTYEQLREIDRNSSQLKTDTINIIATSLNVSTDEITNIEILKKGMTNRSFIFNCNDKKYIMRIPGEGTEQLINREQESSVYKLISAKHLCDPIIYINPKSGYKISEYLEGARVCNPLNMDDVKKCMNHLHKFHELGLQADHEFDIFKQIDFYETLWNKIPSAYKDYFKTKADVCSLKEFIDTQVTKKVLTHIDAVPDNFLFVTDSQGTEDILLIDWEYAGMQDPHVDIAMFCIYSLYTKQEVDNLIEIYFPDGCSHLIRIKIYCYISACGLLWSNWCEYKRILGVEFGDYSLRQYRFAKDYYKLAQEELNKINIQITED